MTNDRSEKRVQRQVPRRVRMEWGVSHDDKPHRDALEHARPPVKNQRADDFRDRETVSNGDSRHAR